MENGRQFEVNLYGKEIGSQVQLDILRGSDTIRRNVIVVERPDAAAQFLDLTSPEQNLVEQLGLLCITVDERIAALIGALVGGRLASRARNGIIWSAKVAFLTGFQSCRAAGTIASATGRQAVQSGATSIRKRRMRSK